MFNEFLTFYNKILYTGKKSEDQSLPEYSIRYYKAKLTEAYIKEIILSDKTSLGYTGFENKGGVATLSFGFPYREAPKSYIRKLTLAPAVTAYQLLKKGETILLTWQIVEGEVKDYSDFVRHTWEYCYDTYSPKPVDTPYSIEYMKQTLSQFFVSSFVDKYPLVYNSGIHLRRL